MALGVGLGSKWSGELQHIPPAYPVTRVTLAMKRLVSWSILQFQLSFNDAILLLACTGISTDVTINQSGRETRVATEGEKKREREREREREIGVNMEAV